MKWELISTERDNQDELWYLFMHKQAGTMIKIHTNDYQAFIRLLEGVVKETKSMKEEEQ